MAFSPEVSIPNSQATSLHGSQHSKTLLGGGEGREAEG